MASLNKVQLIGNLGRDPEIRYTKAGKAVASFSMATTEKWKDESGNKNEKSEWHRIIAWGKLGEICGEYLNKGSSVYIEGKLQTREWEDKDGNKRQTTEIVASQMLMLGGSSSSSNNSNNSNQGNDFEDDGIPWETE